MAENNINDLTPQDAQEAILSPITKALKDNKITLDHLTKKLKGLINCKRTVSVIKYDKDDKEPEYIKVPDNPNQLKAIDMALKLSQAYPAEKLKIESDTDIIINLVQYGVPNKPPKTITEGEE